MTTAEGMRQDPFASRRGVLTSAVVLALLVVLFVVHARPRAWLNDDAFITFRYAAHLAEGHGLVWNTVDPQRVEGSSSLAWTLLNAAAIRVGLDPVDFSHLLGLLTGALTLVVVWLGAWRVFRVGPLVALAAPALLCLQRQWVLWSVSGMETVAAALVVLVATLRFFKEAESSALADAPRRTGVASGGLFLAATLLRPEAPLLHLGAGLGIFAALRTLAAWRVVLTSGLVHFAGLVLLTAWRLVYFGQAFPNTFYVKVGTLQSGPGLRYFGEFLWQNHAWLWLVLVFIALPLARERRRLALSFLLAQVAVWCGWLVALGGGQWEFRLFVPILPALALLLATALHELGTARPPTSVPATASPRGLRLRRAGVAVTIVVIGLSQWQGLRSPFRVFGDLFSVQQLDEMARYMGLEATLLGRYLGPETRICSGWAGVFPFLTDAWHFDPWGLNDPATARQPMDTSRVVFHQRHATWSDVVANNVVFCDVFNHFLFPAEFDPSQPRNVVPWIEPGVPIYSVPLPEGHHWIFASALPRPDVTAHLARLGLTSASVHPLPAGWPSLGQQRGDAAAQPSP